MRSYAICTNETHHATEVPYTQQLMKRLYDKIEDLKIVEDILSQPGAPQATSSPKAMKVIQQLQHEIRLISQQLIGE